jgi:uncharacterized membrane protein YphA (DoxX/SURF4 family)
MLGSRVYGLAAVLLGGVILAWQEFSSTWQPLPGALPRPALLARAAGAIFAAAGIALLVRRWERAAALAVALVSLVFAAGWAGRIAGQPALFAMWLGLAEQAAVVLGGLAVVAACGGRVGPLAHALRVLFGLCLLAFGTAHLLYVNETADFVPAWIPPGQRFWALATGVADIAAGIALLAGPFALLAARLATAMFIGFGLLVWLPRLIAAPTDQETWFGNAVNLSIAAGAWAVADLIARAPPPAWWRRGR